MLEKQWSVELGHVAQKAFTRALDITCAHALKQITPQWNEFGTCYAAVFVHKRTQDVAQGIGKNYQDFVMSGLGNESKKTHSFFAPLVQVVGGFNSLNVFLDFIEIHIGTAAARNFNHHAANQATGLSEVFH